VDFGSYGGQCLARRELGPDGHGIHVTLEDLFPSGTQWKNAVHYVNRDSNLYTASLSSYGGPNEIIQVEDRQSESRFRAMTSLGWISQNGFGLRQELGYERIWNFDFATGSNRNNFLAAVSLRWVPKFK